MRPLQQVDPGHLTHARVPITEVGTPAMQQCLLQSAPHQLQLLSQQLDGLVQPVYRGMALVLYMQAATASSMTDLAAAEASVDKGTRALAQLAKSLKRTGACPP